MTDFQEALGGVVPMTVFRWLRKVSYRSSYNHNGRYYTLYDPAQFDRWGLWSCGDIHFSMDGTLKATVKRLVADSETGYTQRELQELLRVRVRAAIRILSPRSDRRLPGSLRRRALRLSRRLRSKRLVRSRGRENQQHP